MARILIQALLILYVIKWLDEKYPIKMAALIVFTIVFVIFVIAEISSD